MAPDYTDFRLTLEGDPTQGYAVTAHGPGDTYARAQVPHDLDAVQAVLARIELGEAPAPGEMQEVGKHLYNLLFPAEIARLFQQSYAAQAPGTHLRLKLHLRTPALARLPWELAYDGQRFLAARLTHPIVRYVESQTPLKLPPLDLPLRILYVQASPRDRDALDLETSEEVLREAVKGWAEVTVVRGAKPADLLKALHQGEGYHLLHFDGHGGFDTHKQQGFLVFEDDDGAARTLDGALLADYLAGTPIRLVVLAACHSGKASGEQRFVGAAEQLMHDEALTAVVAMQFGVEDASAIAFNRGFYEALAGGYPVEGAVIAGRKAILDHMGGYERGVMASADWASPILFMRVGEGCLFPAAGAQVRQGEQMIRGLVEGVAKLPTDYRTRIQNFLVEYLGTAKHKVPFGGRERELAALDTWLVDQESPPYALLAAEAGRGKSALLVHWVMRLAEHANIAVVFIPISIRFNMSLASVVFTTFAAQLSEVYEEPVLWVNLSAEQWKGVCESYLRRTPPNGKIVVVILDGLDEAADWQVGPELFPAEAVPGVRVVVSARYLAGDVDAAGWRQRLGWERTDQAVNISVQPLDQPGLAEVLYAMGNPLDRLATQVNVVSELYRLSEGDPLVVRLYVEALISHSKQTVPITPEALREIKPGLGGYFDKWWEDQRKLWGKAFPPRERVVEGVFNLLACALGPLKRDDLLELAPPELSLSSWALGEVILSLERFIVGNGEQQGYIFNHSRLGYHFRDKLSQRERALWEERFLVYGKRVLDDLNQGNLPPHETPAYALQYYGAHLERSNTSAERFCTLVSEGWMRAWESLEGTYAGFLTDVTRAWGATDRVNQRKCGSTTLIFQTQYALCFASVVSLSRSISPSLFMQALAWGLLTPTQALVITRQEPDEKQRVARLKTLAFYLPQSLLADALNAACAIRDEWHRASALESLAPLLPETLLPEALNIARALESEWHRANALESLAPLLPEAQRVEALQEALSAVHAIRDELHRANALESLAPLLPEAQRVEALQEALSAAHAIRDELHRANALESLAPLLPEAQRVEALQEALSAVHAIRDQRSRANRLGRIAAHLPEAQRIGTLQEALNIARSLESDWERARALGDLAPYLPEAQQEGILQEALSAAQAIPNEEDRANSLRTLASCLPETQLPVVLSAARTIRDAEERVRTLRTLALYLPDAQHAEILHDALTHTHTIRDEEDRASALESLAPLLPETLLPEALNIARALESERHRASALESLAPLLPEAQRVEALQEALSAAHAIRDELHRANALESLAPHLPEKLLPEALNIVRALESERHRARTLRTLAPHLPEAQQEGILQEALRAARAIQDKGLLRDRARELESLAPLLPETQRVEALQEALRAARAIRDEWHRAGALVTLAPHLPEKLLPEALNIVRALESERHRASALESLAPHLPEKLLPEALNIACALESEWHRANALESLAPLLPEAQRVEALQEALSAVHAIRDQRSRANRLGRMAAHLPEAQRIGTLQEALNIARSLESDWERARALGDLAPYLPEAQQEGILQEALSAAQAIWFEWSRASVLGSLAPHLPETLLPDALVAARTLKHEEGGANVLRSLIPHLPEAQRTEVLREALSAARILEDAGQRAQMLVGLVPHLPEAQRTEVLREALSAARILEDARRRAQMLVGLVPHLPEAQRTEVLREALSAARILEDARRRAQMLVGLVPHLPEAQRTEVLREALSAARILEDAGQRTQMLVGLVPHLPEAQRTEVLREALSAARILEDAGQRAQMLVGLVPHLVSWATYYHECAFPLWSETLHELASNPRPIFLDDLTTLLPFALALAGDDADEVAAGIFHAVQEVCAWWP